MGDHRAAGNEHLVSGKLWGYRQCDAFNGHTIGIDGKEGCADCFRRQETVYNIGKYYSDHLDKHGVGRTSQRLIAAGILRDVIIGVSMMCKRVIGTYNLRKGNDGGMCDQAESHNDPDPKDNLDQHRTEIDDKKGNAGNICGRIIGYNIGEYRGCQRDEHGIGQDLQRTFAAGGGAGAQCIRQHGGQVGGLQLWDS